jgi:hypothetical protein
MILHHHFGKNLLCTIYLKNESINEISMENAELGAIPAEEGVAEII